MARKHDDLSVEIAADTPLRLVEAVRVAFPAGGMTVSGLRKEIERGRLVVEMIAGKQFTTLANIAEMRRLCRVAPKATVDRTRASNADNCDGNTAREHLRFKLRELRDEADLRAVQKRAPRHINRSGEIS